jgi:tetratricopeptide (TPR) repeat protein
MGVDAFDIVAIILGVLFTIRKLDAQRRLAKEFPHVLPEDFARWQQSEVSVYGAAMIACFGKVFADWTFVYFFAEGLPDRMVRAVGATIDLSWFAVMLITFYRTMRLAKTRRQLGIVLGGFVVEGKTELSTEIKSGLRDLEDGDLERAAYKFKQVSLDDDESMKGIALYYLGECQWRMGELQTARETFRESIQADPALLQPKEALKRLEAELAGR